MDTIFDKKVSNIDVPSLLTARNPSIFFQEHHTLIVLIDNIVCYTDRTVSLGLQKVFGPNNLWKNIINANKFAFSRTFCVELCFVEVLYTAPLSQDVSHVTLHIILYHIQCINPPF